jgi:hypothetical protein
VKISAKDADKINALKQSIISVVRDIDPDAADFDVDDALEAAADIKLDVASIEKILEAAA